MLRAAFCLAMCRLCSDSVCTGQDEPISHPVSSRASPSAFHMSVSRCVNITVIEPVGFTTRLISRNTRRIFSR